MCPYFSKTQKKCSFSYNFSAFLENLEDAKINRKIHFSKGCRGSKFQKFPWGACPWIPIIDLHFRSGAILSLFHHAKCFASFSVLAPRQSA